MSGTLANIGLVVVFILIGSMFAAAEMSLVSLRDSQVRSMSTRGRRGEAVARLAKDPNRFLAAVQVGVTLAGFLSASFGRATLSGDLAPKLVGLGVPEIEAKVYEERLHKGNILVSVHVDDPGQENVAGQIFASMNAKHIATVPEAKPPE